MPKPTLNLLPTRRRLLIEMHAALARGESGLHSEAQLMGLTKATRGLLAAALDECMAVKEIFVVEPEQTGLEAIYNTQYRAPSKPFYRLTGVGIRVVENMSSKEYELYSDSEFAPAQDEASSERWEPLPIDRGAPEYEKMIASAEAALTEIESNNGYAHDQPDERESIVVAIKGTLNSIKNSNPTTGLVGAGLLRPLRFIAKKFSGAALGEAAKLAVVAIIDWLSKL